jgi:hypothetical protein
VAPNQFFDFNEGQTGTPSTTTVEEQPRNEERLWKRILIFLSASALFGACYLWVATASALSDGAITRVASGALAFATVMSAFIAGGLLVAQCVVLVAETKSFQGSVPSSGVIRSRLP